MITDIRYDRAQQQFAVRFDDHLLGYVPTYSAGQELLDDYAADLIAHGLMCSVAPMDEMDAPDLDEIRRELSEEADNRECERQEQGYGTPRPDREHDHLPDEPWWSTEAGAVAESESGPPCVTCGDPATTTIHGFAFCEPCGEDAQQALDDAPPAVDDIDTGAILAGVKRQQQLLRGQRVLWKRRPGKRASRVRPVEVELVALLKGGRANVRLADGRVLPARRSDLATLANWNSESKEAA